MPFEAPLTIKDVMEKVMEMNYVLPSIQRNSCGEQNNREIVRFTIA